MVCLATLAVALAATPAFAQRTAGTQTDMQGLAHGVLFELNRIRSEHGLAPLTLNSQLSDAARQHTSEMIADGYFAHESYGGGAFWKRMTSYIRAAKSSWSVGENLLWSAGDTDPQTALQLWMASPEHRHNILTPDWRQIGISAIYADSAPGTYDGNPVTVITTDFGVRT
jgi:uncharacterized protein YkwD